ncbi:chemotaxis protein CheD [Desulfuromonas sp. TF]|uniref:chemotaxis protein CheD n=1 Tax=Desulfuromonas sp. TF TaxID=1232410 RepID=UPI0005584683|nr:chemotaxis protein CheD [Desulfuromonas sp. TF]
MNRVGISEFKTGRAPAVLVTYGLGSCLGITLYDPRKKLGGLAHTLLPLSRPEDRSRMTKYVDSAIRLMMEELLELGAEKDCLVAKISGGANMFEALHPSGAEGVGARNARAARETLELLGIPLLAEDIGGNHGRTVEFDLATGEVRVRSVCHPDANRTL